MIRAACLRVAQEVDEAAGCRNDDLWLGAQVDLLFAERHATNDATTAHVSELAQDSNNLSALRQRISNVRCWRKGG